MGERVGVNPIKRTIMGDVVGPRKGDEGKGVESAMLIIYIFFGWG
jgi:hypothetical protein